MSTQIPHELIQERDYTGIKIGGWKITCAKRPICNAEELERITQELQIKAHPEMLFGNNFVKLQHDNGVTIYFDTRDALKLVSQTSQTDIKVSASKTWIQSKQTSVEAADIFTKQTIDYDWTYTTPYNGTILVDGKELTADQATQKGKPTTTKEQIDLEKLKRPDQILYYNEIHLFQDELADNGDSTLTVKLRVMPSCFFVLQRFWLRVDDVIFRMIDTRLYHEFGTSYVLREFQIKESPYHHISQMLPPGDPTKITDVNLVSQLLSKKVSMVEKIPIN